MTARKKSEEDADSLSVAQAMQLVRWDFEPESDDGSFEVSTGAFFEEFPWDGDGAPPDKAKRPKSGE